jgi:hypothetical protein
MSFFSQKQMGEISVQVREMLNQGFVEPLKSLKLKEIFDRYRDENNPEKVMPRKAKACPGPTD